MILQENHQAILGYPGMHDAILVGKNATGTSTNIDILRKSNRTSRTGYLEVENLLYQSIRCFLGETVVQFWDMVNKTDFTIS